MPVPSLRGFEGLREIGGDLTLLSLDAITEVGAFSSLDSIGGEFALQSDAKLVSVELKPSYNFAPYVGGSIFVADNPALKKLTAFVQPMWEACDLSHPMARSMTIDGNDGLEEIVLPDTNKGCVFIADNAQLSGIGSTRHSGSPSLLALQHLPMLSRVDLGPISVIGSLQLLETGLETLDGFGKVECELRLDRNPVLRDMSALMVPSSVVTVQSTFDTRFRVVDNPALATCQVQTIADLLPAPTGSRCGDDTVTRAIEIAGNDDTAVCP